MIPTLMKTSDFQQWLATAEPGQRVIVQTCINCENEEVRKEVEAGLVTANHQRADEKRWHLIVTRLRRGKRDKPPLGAGSVTWQTNGGTSPHLTERVMEAIELYRQGLDSKQIGERLNVSPKTARAYVRRGLEEGAVA